MNREFSELDAAYKCLGGRGATPDSVTLLIENYGKRSRFYHSHRHREYMAAPVSAALLAWLGAMPEEKVGELDAFCNIIGNAHDSQYIEVDGGLSDTAARLVEPYMDVAGKGLRLRDTLPDVPSVQLTLHLFGLAEGQDLSALREHNEFLSALVAALDMEHAGVPLKAIARVVQGVAGTVPFKSQHYMQELKERLASANETFTLGLSAEEQELSLLLTTDLANRDIASFCDTDLGAFVTGTMELIPENLAAVRGGATPAEFLASLHWSIRFFSVLQSTAEKDLDIGNVFHQTAPGDYPADIWYRQATAQARVNVEACTLYLKCKVASAGLVAAVATLIGEPETLLLDFVDGGEYDGILQGETSVLNHEEQRILRALESRGHGNIGRYDIDGSPIGKIMLEKLGSAKMLALYDAAQAADMQDKTQARGYLTRVERALETANLRAILHTLAEVARDPARGRRREINTARVAALEGLV